MSKGGGKGLPSPCLFLREQRGKEVPLLQSIIFDNHFYMKSNSYPENKPREILNGLGDKLLCNSDKGK